MLGDSLSDLKEKLMKRLAYMAALMSALCVGPAMADTVQNSIGNRVVLTFPDGAQITLRLRADGTISQTTPNAQTP